MNRNMLLAFALILICFQFFFSEFYYEKILRKPHPHKNREMVRAPAPADTVAQRTMQDPDGREGPARAQQAVEPAPAIPSPVSISDTAARQADTVWIETDKLICGISETGGMVVSIKTKEYTYHNGAQKDEPDYVEIIPAQSSGGCGLKINEWLFDQDNFAFSGDTNRVSLGDNDSISLRFICARAEGEGLTKEFTFHRGSYTIDYRIISDRLDGKNIETFWGCGINESEDLAGRDAQMEQRRAHLYDGKNVEHIIMKKRGAEERTGYYNWMAISAKYFLVACIPATVKDAEIRFESFEITDKDVEDKKNKTLNYKMIYKSFASGNAETFRLYAGPSQLTEMKRYDADLQKVLFRGYRWFFWADKWFPQVCEFVLWLLIQLQKGVTDYGIVIILLTIILKIVTWPLTQSSMKSMNRMKEMQPRINKIRERYKSNTKLMNQKLMEFYKEEGINPLGGMGGCLPMMLQMPIMISLFIVLRKAIELRGQGTVLIPWIKDLSQAEVLFPLGFTIPFYGSNVALLPILMAVLMYFQNKATIKDPNQKMMIYFMPVMMLVLFNNFPSGLVLYFTFSSALQVAQQILTDRKKKAAA